VLSPVLAGQEVLNTAWRAIATGTPNNEQPRSRTGRRIGHGGLWNWHKNVTASEGVDRGGDGIAAGVGLGAARHGAQ
jgi:hypothetical protein